MIDIIAEGNSDSLKEKINDVLVNLHDVRVSYPNSSKADLVKYQEIIPIIGKLEFFKGEMGIELIGFPLCVFPRENYRWMGFINMIIPSGGVFTDKCLKCHFKKFCLGVPKSYIDKFGDEELIPPTDEEVFCVDMKNADIMKPHWEASVHECSYHWDNFFKDIPGKILDVGTGMGAFASFAPKRITGVDMDDYTVNNAMKDLLNLDLRVQDITALDFLDGTFDGVHSRFVLEHMAHNEAGKAVSEMVRVLKPGGKIFILAAGLHAISGSLSEDDKTHFTKEDLIKFAEENNLSRYRVVRGDFYQPFFNFNFDAEEPVTNAKEIAVLLIGEK